MATGLLLALLLQAAAAQDAPKDAPKDEGLLKKGSFAGSYLLPGTNVSARIGGYVKVDVIHDFDAIGSEDAFDPRTIPTDGSTGENTQITARQTRLNLDVRTPTEWGDARGFVEADFAGSGNTLRLRHAYGSVGGLLAGQTWSTFMDEDAMPPTLDFEEPTAYAMIRVAQVRWTQRFSEDFYAAFAIEAPDSQLTTMPTAGTRQDPYPDLTTRWRWTHGMGHVQLSGFAAWARFDPAAGSPDDAFLWGVLLAGTFKLFEKDTFQYQLGYGPGLGRYRGGDVAGPNESGNLVGIPVSAWLLDYEHFWTDTWSSNVCYSVARAGDTGGLGPATPKTLRYAAVNLVWRFLPWALTGVEYLYGQREDRDGASGEANRIMLSFKFSIP